MHLQKAWRGNTGSPLADSPIKSLPWEIFCHSKPKTAFENNFWHISSKKSIFSENIWLNESWNSKTLDNVPKTHFSWLETHLRPLTSIWSRNHKIVKIHFFCHFLPVLYFKNIDETFQIWAQNWKSESKMLFFSSGKLNLTPNNIHAQYEVPKPHRNA